MVKSGLTICTIFAIALSSPASAQLIGDLNCNGFAWEIADAVLAARFLIEACEMYPPPCLENSDIDGDGRGLTIGDIMYYLYTNHNPPIYPNHPESDTLAVESAVTHPGETIALPVWISSIDTIMGFQFLLELDTDYLVFDSLIADDRFYLNYCICNEHIYCDTPSRLHFPVINEPGLYHVCDLIITTNPDINEPVVTSLLFSSIPSRALYTGLANSNFFLPVMIDAEIQILPLTDIESGNEIIPSDFEISVYPNPFNDAVNISVFSDRATEIMVYDIMGRPVKTFVIKAGNNLVKWNATDENGQTLSAGIYFIGENNTQSFRKVLYLR